MKHLNIDYYQDYIDYIHRNPIEADLFLDKFTINYTYFFRNIEVFENFEKFIKFYVKSNRKSAIKIWSAPCATGDEPYSIALLLHHLKKNDSKFPDFKVYASDIDINALKIANEGIYGEYAVHELPKHYLKSYFSKKITELGPKFTISDEIKDKVEFLQEDIIKGHKQNLVYDVIFCRNFFIYINHQSRDDLLRIIDKRLHTGGLLILGGSENISQKNAIFQSISIRDHFYMKKLSTLSESYKIQLTSLFERKKVGKSHKETHLQKIQKKEVVRKKTKKVLSKIIPSVFNLEKHKIEKGKATLESQEIPEIESAEVRITGLTVNNGIKQGKTAFKSSYPAKQEGDPLERRERKVEQRELLLKQKEREIEDKITNIEQQLAILENDKKDVKELLLTIEGKELEITNRTLFLDRLTRQLEQRERDLNLKEKQLEKRLTQVEQYSKQMINQELLLNNHSMEIDSSLETEDHDHYYEEKRIDCIEKAVNKNELLIPMGYYSLINSFDEKTTASKFTIKGLGTGIGLVLYDPKNNIFAMSNISLPNSSASKQGYHLLFPHTFIDTSVKDLFNRLLYNGANKDNLRALVVGGAKLFLDYDMTYQENIDTIKKELKTYQITIEAEDLGGLSERSIIYDTINDALYVKKSWEFEYRKIT
jgi:chemotaxis protein methyltransferase CheR